LKPAFKFEYVEIAELRERCSYIALSSLTFL